MFNFRNQVPARTYLPAPCENRTGTMNGIRQVQELNKRELEAVV